MPIARFVNQLADSGRVVIDSNPTPSGLSLDAEIRELDAVLRDHAPGDAPELELAAATFAAERLYRACVFLAERNTPPEEVSALLTADGPAPSDATTVWSVDLFFRYLGDVTSLAAGLPADDALRRSLRDLATTWPLSGLTVRGAEPPDAPPVIADDPCLRRLWRDRIPKPGYALGAAPAKH